MLTSLTASPLEICRSGLRFVQQSSKKKQQVLIRYNQDGQDGRRDGACMFLRRPRLGDRVSAGAGDGIRLGKVGTKKEAMK